jgi:hypothetical protein
VTFKGLFGHPRTLCVDTAQLVCDAIKEIEPEKPCKFVVVNTVGVSHPDRVTDPPRSISERIILWLLEKLLPPPAYIY